MQGRLDQMTMPLWLKLRGRIVTRAIASTSFTCRARRPKASATAFGGQQRLPLPDPLGQPDTFAGCLEDLEFKRPLN